MADAETDRSTDPDLLDLLAQVQAYAAANGSSPAEVAARLLSLLSNNAPPVVDVGGPPAAPPPPAQPGRSSWLTMSRTKRAELREKNRNIVAEAAAVPDAEAILFWERKRAELAASVAEAQLPEVSATMLVELMMAAASSQGGSPPMKAEVMALRALLRAADSPGSIVRELRVLDHVYPFVNALDAAADGWPGALLKLQPAPRQREADRLPSSAAAILTALTGVAMDGMLRGGVLKGAIPTQEAAEVRVRAAFAREGIVIAVERPRKDLRLCRRLENAAARGQPLCEGDQTQARDTLTLYQAAGKAIRRKLDASAWPTADREAWLATVAVEAWRHTSPAS
jgi:hypothetical protein